MTTTQELMNERALSAAEVWQAAEARLLQPMSKGLNTVTEVCDRWADDPNRTAFIVRDSPRVPGRRWTFAEVADASARLATALAQFGVGRGDRVAAVLPQGIEAHLSALAVWRLGAVFVPVYPGFGVDGLQQRLGHSRPVSVITDHASGSAVHEATAGTATRTILVRAENEASPAEPGISDFWALVHSHEPLQGVARTAASDTATLLYTSGTTGTPKGCQLPHSYLVTMQPYTRHTYALGSDDVFASTSSPGWVNGLFSAGFCVSGEGVARVLYTGRFDPEAWIEILEQEHVTYFSSAPSAMRRIIPAFDTMGFPSSLRGGACAGEHQGAELARQWSTHCDSPLQETYGTTEIGLVMATPAYPASTQEPGALPPAVPGFEVALLDPTGHPTADETGVIGVRSAGPVGCTGYLDQDRLWAERWSGGWYVTGDLARRDALGQFWFRGRDDDLIVTSGYNVGPAEVEGVLATHPLVRDVAVLAAPDTTRGSVVRAVVVPAVGADLPMLKGELQTLARERLGRHAYPRRIDFADDLPRNAAGKVERRALRD